MDELRDQRDDGKPELIKIKGLWHNSFGRAVGGMTNMGLRLRSSLASASSFDLDLNYSRIMSLSISQGQQLVPSAVGLGKAL